MVARSWRSAETPENMTVAGGALVVTSGTPLGPISTAVTPAATVNGPTQDLGAVPNQRIGVLAQWVAPGNPTVPSGITFEIQWSLNGTDWFPAPTSTQGESRMSLITTSGQDKSMVTRGQVLARYWRWSIGGANLPAGGTVHVWYGRIS